MLSTLFLAKGCKVTLLKVKLHSYRIKFPTDVPLKLKPSNASVKLLIDGVRNLLNIIATNDDGEELQFDEIFPVFERSSINPYKSSGVNSPGRKRRIDRHSALPKDYRNARFRRRYLNLSQKDMNQNVHDEEGNFEN